MVVNQDHQADLANPQWSTNFYQAEQILLRTDLTPTEGELIYGHDLLMIIEKTAALLPSALPKNEEDRVKKLIKLAHPPKFDSGQVLFLLQGFQKLPHRGMSTG